MNMITPKKMKMKERTNTVFIWDYVYPKERKTV